MYDDTVYDKDIRRNDYSLTIDRHSGEIARTQDCQQLTKGLPNHIVDANNMILEETTE